MLQEISKKYTFYKKNLKQIVIKNNFNLLYSKYGT